MGVIVSMLLLALVQQTGVSADTSEFWKLEDLWNQAHLKGDAETLDRLWVDNIVVIVPKMPPFSKSEALSVFRSGRMKFDRYATSEVKIRAYEGCVVVTGRLLRSRTMGSRVVDDDWRFTKVYVRVPGAWQVVTFHASEAGE